MFKYSEFVNTQELRDSRIKKNMTCKNMADLMGLKSQTSYYNIEVGIVEPKISQMISISRILKKPITKFFNLKVQ